MLSYNFAYVCFVCPFRFKFQFTIKLGCVCTSMYLTCSAWVDRPNTRRPAPIGTFSPRPAWNGWCCSGPDHLHCYRNEIDRQSGLQTTTTTLVLLAKLASQESTDEVAPSHPVLLCPSAGSYCVHDKLNCIEACMLYDFLKILIYYSYLRNIDFALNGNEVTRLFNQIGNWGAESSSRLRLNFNRNLNPP